MWLPFANQGRLPHGRPCYGRCIDAVAGLSGVNSLPQFSDRAMDPVSSWWPDIRRDIPAGHGIWHKNVRRRVDHGLPQSGIPDDPRMLKQQQLGRVPQQVSLHLERYDSQSGRASSLW